MPLLLAHTGLPALQLALFGALSLVAVLAWRRFRAARPACHTRVQKTTDIASCYSGG